MVITALYAGLLGILFVGLSVRVIGVRRAERISLGTGQSAELLTRTRSHGNFAEYVPIALIMMGLAEQLRAPLYSLHLVGLALLVGRLSHAIALSRSPSIFALRTVGMSLTLAALIIGSALCLWLSIGRLILLS